ncbi:Rho-GAP domain-containing protein [Caenorhabditis elegans]|uniref:Rho-GAP domain-containing protein n=1 Tax=Caenorhabditis elegans TaxID=6239 RepID=U4PAK0_CAEEL|nr:Rho-GAP domain-containing protein [Caenorhabditis elegans]CDH92922.1 Rho-GAP domain-containing protein [Caenorhabditis elegans]|eukprot:NP_001293531.1 Rho GTPase Activating protein [Caenorhabditis elegans]
MTVASYSMVLCGSSDDHRYRGRIEKVKFGVPINEAFAHDIPATLLMLLLKVNKDGPAKKDIWRAPGNQAQVRKLSQVMQHGRLVNIENFTVYTAASVIKKFLSKLPNGIFGRDNEETLFNSASTGMDIEKQRQVFYRIFGSLPVASQHLLVLLFGTFRVVADSSDGHSNAMNPNAIAISVAPSLFHTCIHDGRTARVEDLQRFKLASNIVCSIICSFGDTKLFPRECYEYYARYTGRTLRIDENRMFTFHNPSSCFSMRVPTIQENEPMRNQPSTSRATTKPMPTMARLNNRLSSSVGEVLIEGISDVEELSDLDIIRPLTACGGDRSLSYLQYVHENQARRMRSRSEWFLSPVSNAKKTSSKSVDYFGPVTIEENPKPTPLPKPARAPLQTSSKSNISNASDDSVPTRRRSLKMQMRAAAFASNPSHSLDYQEVGASNPRLRGHTSVEDDTWLAEVVPHDEIPKKRRSLKKKTSTQF